MRERGSASHRSGRERVDGGIETAGREREKPQRNASLSSEGGTEPLAHSAGDDDGSTIRSHRLQEARELLRCGRITSTRDIIHQQEPRLGEHRAGEREASQVAASQRIDAAIRATAQPRSLECTGYPMRTVAERQVADDRRVFQRLPYGEKAVRKRSVPRVRDANRARRAVTPRGGAEPRYHAAVGSHQ